MRKFLLSLTCCSLFVFPVLASEQTDAFTYFMDVHEKNRLSGGMRVVEVLNRHTLQGKTINQVSDDPEFSPDFESDAPLLLKNFKMFLQQLQAKGYGTGSFERWNVLSAKGSCDEPIVILYSNVLHGSRKKTFGFYMSPGESLVSPEEIAAKALRGGCM